MTHHHLYEVTVQAITENGQTTATQPIQFHTSSHDDLHDIVARAQSLADLEKDVSTQLAIGAKLLGSVMLPQRGHPLFAEFAPHFKTFMQTLKARSK